MTKYAIISDIHSNLEALEAVAADIEKQGVDRLVCCGDLVGYGANPSHCMERFRELGASYGQAPLILGNHDQAAITGKTYGFNQEAAAAAKWTHQRLSSTNLRRLARSMLKWSENNLLFTHASPSYPGEWNYLWTPDQAELEFDSFSEQICFVGHIHRPYFYIHGTEQFVNQNDLFVPPNVRCMVNAGSVGQPRDGDPRASYCIYDEGEHLLKIRRVEYDFTLTATKIIQAGLPKVLAERLAYGY
ncbi:MAG: metallophosphoesterase family protein [bacterium]